MAPSPQPEDRASLSGRDPAARADALGTAELPRPSSGTREGGAGRSWSVLAVRLALAVLLTPVLLLVAISYLLGIGFCLLLTGVGLYDPGDESAS
jgi:hypothetical protein